MGIRAEYPSMYSTTTGLKPFLALEFYLAGVKIEPKYQLVTSLVKETLGSKIKYSQFPVNSIAIVETAAEK